MKSAFGILYFASFIALGAAVSVAQKPELSDPVHYSSISAFDSNLVVMGTPDGSPAMTSYGKKIIIKLQYFRFHGKTYSTSGKILVHVKSKSIFDGPQYGGLYALLIKLRQPSRASIPGGFDWQNHLKDKGVYHECWINQSDIQELKRPDGIAAISNKCKDYVEGLLVKTLKNKADLGVASALLMGNENWLDNETENNFAAAGVLHVLCVSGMHLVLLYGILIKLFNPILRKKPRLSHFVFPLLVFTIWFYSLLTGMSPSITRAATMTTFVILSEWLGRRVDKSNLMCASLILLCCLEPGMLLSAGFQLSFLAVCGIFYLHPVILSSIEPENRLMRHIWEMTSVTLAAQIATFPLSLYLFGQFPNWFLVANMVIVPVSTLVMYVGMVLVILGNIPWIEEWLGEITSISIQFLRYLVDLISSLPFAVTDNIYFPSLLVVSTYATILILFYFFSSNTYYSLVACLLTLIFCLASILKSETDFAKEDSCWMTKSKSGPILINQRGNIAEIIAFSGVSGTELKRIEGTLATKRNVRLFKKTIINQKTNIWLKRYQTTYIHRFPYNWNLNSENLKSLENTRILIMETKPYEGLWDRIDKSMPHIKKMVLLKRSYLSEKSLAKAESLGIQICSLDEIGYVRL